MTDFNVYKSDEKEISVDIEDSTSYRFMYLPEEKIVVLPPSKYADSRLVKELENDKNIEKVCSHKRASFENF